MKFFKILTLLFLTIGSLILFIGNRTHQSISQAELDEFELLNLCHCYEYLELRNLDYIKWDPNGRSLFLDNMGNQMFGRYLAVRLHSQYFQKKYDSSFFFKNGYSKYRGFNLDFSRLDSMYYEPMVQYYVNKISNTENLPYLGYGDVSAFFDCYYRIKEEIPLEKEYEIFLKYNSKYLK